MTITTQIRVSMQLCNAEKHLNKVAPNNLESSPSRRAIPKMLLERLFNRSNQNWLVIYVNTSITLTCIQLHWWNQPLNRLIRSPTPTNTSESVVLVFGCSAVVHDCPQSWSVSISKGRIDASLWVDWLSLSLTLSLSCRSKRSEFADHSIDGSSVASSKSLQSSRLSCRELDSDLRLHAAKIAPRG